MMRKLLSRWAVVTVCAIFLFVILFTKDKELFLRISSSTFEVYVDRDVSCYESAEANNFGQFDANKEFLAGGMNIFFHETSCFGNSETILNARQACAVESAAKMNSNMTVYLFFLSPVQLSNSSKKLIQQLSKYKNVKIRRLVIKDYVKHTPLEQWYYSGVLKTSNWPMSHMSDILRYLTLWKFGGIYLDLDVVVKSPLHNLTNFAGAEDWLDVAAGVIGLSGTGFGREIADECLRDLRKNFRGNIWGNNGPGVITRTLQKICGVTYAKNMTPEKCKGFRVFPPSTFYPIYFKQWKKYFEEKDSNETMQTIKSALAVHVWNKFSKSESVRVNSKVPYVLLAKQYCPNVYNNCGPIF